MGELFGRVRAAWARMLSCSRGLPDVPGADPSHGCIEHSFMNLTTSFRVLTVDQHQQGETWMRNLILGAVSAVALASPAMAADFPVESYSESYARSYEYRTQPVIIERSAPVVSETVVV